MSEARALLRALLAGDASALPREESAWSALASRAAELGAEGLLHASVRAAGVGAAVPAKLADRLRRAHAATAAKNLELEAEATRLLAAFARAGVLAVPMKGTALFAAGVVRDLGTRPTGDVDLATRRSQRGAALRVLIEQGFAVDLTQRSWKHLPAMRRGDLAVELHEVAYWSGATRAAFDADHLGAGDDATRLARLWALQVHHLVLGSPPDAALLVRTVADVASFARLAAVDPRLAARAPAAMTEAGVEAEAAALDAIAALATGRARGLPALPLDEDVVRALLLPLEAGHEADARRDALAHLLATAHRQPLSMLAATAATLLQGPSARAGGAEGEGTSSGWLRRARRPLQLAARVIATLPAAVRAARRRGLTRRAGGRWRSGS